MATFISPIDFKRRSAINFFFAERDRAIEEARIKHQEGLDKEAQDKDRVASGIGSVIGASAGAAGAPEGAKVAGALRGASTGAQAGSQFGQGNIAGGFQVIGNAVAREQEQQQRFDQQTALQNAGIAERMTRAGYVRGTPDAFHAAVAETQQQIDAINSDPGLTRAEKDRTNLDLISKVVTDPRVDQRWVLPKGPSPQQALQKVLVRDPNTGILFTQDPKSGKFSVVKEDDNSMSIPDQNKFIEKEFARLSEPDAKTGKRTMTDQEASVRTIQNLGRLKRTQERARQISRIQNEVQNDPAISGNISVPQGALPSGGFLSPAGPRPASPQLQQPSRGVQQPQQQQGGGALSFLQAVAKSEGTTDPKKWSDNGIRQAAEAARDIGVKLQAKKLQGPLNEEEKELQSRIIIILEKVRDLAK